MMQSPSDISSLESSLAAAQAEGLATNLRRAIAFIALDGYLELQAIGVRKHPNDAYVMSQAAHAATPDDAIRLCQQSERILAQGVYILPANLKPGVETRNASPGQWYQVPRRGGTSDSDIASRRILGVDLDVQRPSAISSTDLQMRQSVAVSLKAYAYLANVIPPSALAFVHSGNGRQLWIALDSIPADEESKNLSASILAGLGSMFSTDTVKVDLKLFDAKRILPACGTTKKKGAEGIADRPHRRTAIVTPSAVERLSLAAYRALAERVRRDCSDTGKRAFDLAAGIKPQATPHAPTNNTGIFDKVNAIPPLDVAEWLDLYESGELRCPGCGESQGVDVIDQGLKCLHNRCADKFKAGFRTNVDMTMEVHRVDARRACEMLAEKFGIPYTPYSSYKSQPQPKHKSDPPPANNNDDWPEPWLFGAAKTIAFPLDTLPSWMRQWAAEEAVACQVPEDLPACLVLGVASLVCSRGYDLQVSPGWVEPINLWIASALPPGERKSAVFSHAMAPIHRALEGLQVFEAKKIRERNIDRKILEGQLQKATDAAIKGGMYNGMPAQKAALEIANELDSKPEIFPTTFLVDDITPEALARALSYSNERIGLVSSEGGGPFDMMAGRYSENIPNLDIYLKAHAGDSHLVTRIGRPSIQLKRPLVTMIVTLQPAVVEKLSVNEGFRGRGLLARVLYSLPKTYIGKREVDPPPMTESTSARYADAVLHLIARAQPITQKQLRLSSEADQRRIAFQKALEPRLSADGDLHPIVDWANKLTGAVCRIAAVLQLAGEAEEDETTLAVSGSAFEAAERIGMYFLDNALRAFDAMTVDNITALAKRLWDWLKRTTRSEFTERDAQRALTIERDLTILVLARMAERGLVRKRPDYTPVRAKRKSPTYEVNPLTTPNEILST